MTSIRAIKLLKKVQRVMIKVRIILHNQDGMELSPETDFAGPVNAERTTEVTSLTNAYTVRILL